MLRRVRETGPAFLVPLAWAFAGAAHLDLVGLYPVQVAHGVMATLLAAFAVTGWREMDAGVLRAWRSVIAAGFGLTAVGLAVLLADPELSLLLAAVVAGWMFLPGVALLYTAQAVERIPEPYLLGGAFSIAGGLLYSVSALLALALAPVVVAIALTAFGQTMSILAAVTHY